MEHAVSTVAPLSTASPRTRFSLAELLGVVAGSAAAAAILAPFVSFDAFAWSNIRGPVARSLVSNAALALFVMGLLGGGAALIAVARMPWNHCGRVLGLALPLGLALVPVVALRASLPAYIRPPIAANESAAIAACKTYAEAQDIFQRTDWDSDGVLEYAQNLSMTTESARSTCCDSVQFDFGLSSAEGPPGVATPNAGYVFKILKAQGPNATGGAKSYLTQSKDGRSHMTEGYALLAVPADFGVTGRAIFMVNHVGTVFQRDFGPDETPHVYDRIESFDPGPGWTPAE